MKLQPTRLSIAILTVLFPAIPLTAAATAYSGIDLSTSDGEARVLIPGDTITYADTGTAVNISGANNSLSGNGISIQSGIAGTSVSTRGVTVSAGGTLELSGSSFNAMGRANANALVVRDAGSKAILNGTTIETEGLASRGVHAINGGHIKVTGGSVSTRGDHAHGLNAAGADATITAQNSHITALGNGASAVYAENGASIVLDQARLNAAGTTTEGGNGISTLRGSVTATNTYIVSARGKGIRVEGGTVSLSNGTINVHDDGVLLATPSYQSGTLPPPSIVHLRDVMVHSVTGNGFNANSDDAQARLERVQISSNGSQVSGIWLPGRNGVVTAKDSTIEMTGTNGVGVDNRAGTFTMDGGSITTRGTRGYGLYVSELYAGSDSRATSTARGVAIETFGEGAIGVVSRLSGASAVLEGGSVTTHGNAAYGMLANGAHLAATGTTVRTYGESSHGLMMGNAGVAVTLDGVGIRTSGAGANGLLAYSRTTGVDSAISIRNSHIETEDGNGIMVEGSGLTANLADTTIIGKSGGGNGTLLYVNEWAPPSTSGTTSTIAARNVQLDAQRSRLEGDVVLDSGSASVSLRDHSVLTGALRGNAGRMVDTLSIDGTSTWRVRGDSAVTRLDNAGTVSFVTPGSGFKVLDVTGNLSGGGLFEMRTDLGAGRGDLLRVGGTVEGIHRVLVANSGAEPLTGGGSLKIIQSEGGPGSFKLANRDQVVDAGTYRYTLQTSDKVGGRPTDWSLVNTSQLWPETAPPPDPSQIAPPTPDDLSTTANAAINTSGAGTAHAIWYAERGTLVRRMGELRQGKDEGGVWMRGFGERQKLDNRGGRAFAQTVSGLELGVDKYLPVDGGRWYVGGITGYSSADRRFHDEGGGGADSYHLGGYATWLADTGWYVDSVLKANRIRQDFKVTATDGQSVKAKSYQNAIGMSVEGGRQIRFGEGWFVEPQVALSMLHAGGANYHASNGLGVNAGSGNSIQLRVGSLLGRRYELANGNAVQPYIKLSQSQEFDGKSTVRTNGIATRTDLSGGRTELGLGIAASLGANHRLYADYEYASGSRLDQPWSLSMGYRYTW